MRLSNKIQSLEGSKTVMLSSRLQQLRRKGGEIINLAVGEPDHPTPAPVIDATMRALSSGRTRYGPVMGLPALRESLSARFDGYGADNILITNGSKQALFMIFQVLCDPGDEVVIPVPCWVSFPQQVRAAGGRPVLVPTRNHQLDCERIRRALSARTRAILVNSPNNPTGAVYPPGDLEKIARLAAEHDVLVICDEAYDAFVYDDARHTSMFDFVRFRDRVIVVRSFSKSFAMTGFRVGYVAAGEQIIAALARLQSHLCGNVCTFAQYGALAALALGDDLLEKWRDGLQRKRDAAHQLVTRWADCVRPAGAFYLFPDVSRHLAKNDSSEAFAARLLDEAGVAVVAGEAFGMPGHIRISFAVAEDDLKEGLERIAGAL